MIPSKTIDEILTTARVDEVIEDFVNLRRRGVNLIGRCPFHDEKTPSFTVSPSKGIYKCFGCGKGGTAVNFIMEHESLSYPEALRYLANKYNITVEESVVTNEEREAKQLSDSLYIVNEFARQYFTNQLFHSDEGKSIGLSYFKERGYIEGMIKKFDLGYTGNHRDELTKQALEKSFNIEHLKLVGLTSKSDNDFFRSRVMFTIHNLSGKAIAFAGRIMGNEKNQPKYINSPESEIYNKRKVLYGIFQAKTEIRKLDECLLVEGYTDVLTLVQGGIENVVASSGTALTVEQIRLIKRFTQNIRIIYDGDAAGIKAALRGLDLALEEDMNVRLVLLPDKEDPDSYMRKVGSEKFSEYLQTEGKDFVLFKANLLMSEVANDPIKKAEAIKDIVSSIAKVPDSFKRATYVSYTSAMLEMNEQIMIDQISKALRQQAKAKRLEQDKESHQRRQEQDEEKWITEKTDSGNVQVINTAIYADEFQERDLARILITGGDKWYDEESKLTVAEYLIENIADEIDTFESPLYMSIMNIGKEFLAEGKQINSSVFTNHSDENVASLAIDFLVSPYTLANWGARGIILQTQKIPEENFQKDCFQAIMRYKFKRVNHIIENLRKELLKSQFSEEEKLIQIKIIQQYTKERNEIAAELTTVVFN